MASPKSQKLTHAATSVMAVNWWRVKPLDAFTHIQNWKAIAPGVRPVQTSVAQHRADKSGRHRLHPAPTAAATRLAVPTVRMRAVRAIPWAMRAGSRLRGRSVSWCTTTSGSVRSTIRKDRPRIRLRRSRAIRCGVGSIHRSARADRSASPQCISVYDYVPVCIASRSRRSLRKCITVRNNAAA